MFTANSGKKSNPIGGDTILRMICQKGARINIGTNCAISNSTLWANEIITIEDNVIIGGGCRIWDGDFHPMDDKEREAHSSNFISKPILIRRNCFIGGSCIILKGVTIGERSVIGAGSVVTKSVPDGEIWAGNPAKFLKNVK